MRHPSLIVPGLALALFACEADDWGPEKLYLGRTSAELNQLHRGQQVYATYCVGCHGEEGNGEGRAAEFLEPKPRNFTVGRVKFAAVSAGEAPRDEDYLRIITNGLKGTSMPSFKLLSLEDRTAVVAYIKTFYKDWADDPPGGGISVGQDPWRDDPEAGIADGRKTYHVLAKCWSCHPAYISRAEIAKLHVEDDLAVPGLRDDLYESTEKDSNWGAPIRAPDFYWDRIKTGTEIANLTRVIASGVGGTAMPTWSGSIENEQLWGLGYYVHSLAKRRGSAGARAEIARLKTMTSTAPGTEE